MTDRYYMMVVARIARSDLEPCLGNTHLWDDVELCDNESTYRDW